MLRMWFYWLMAVFPCWVCSAVPPGNCPVGVRNLHYLPKYVGTNCQFNWTNREAMIEKVRDRMKHRHKVFLRFNVPVFHLDSDWTWKRSPADFDTWVWVAATHEYMLHFPHNFNVLSIGTMGIITNNFWPPGGEGKINGYCCESCLELGKTTTPRCTLTWKDLSEFMSDVTAEQKTEWNYVCHQVNYDVSDVVLDKNAAIPDMFYYWRFLSQLLTARPYLKCVRKDDFIHYNCFEKNGQSERKELLMNYFVIMIIAILLWLYSPLLIYYFPSSEPTWPNYPTGLTHTEFHCTHKSPVYLGSLVRCLLGFYIGRGATGKSRVRRLLFVICTFAFSLRLFFTDSCGIFVCFMVVCVAITAIPDFWSLHLTSEQPTHFMNFLEYPEGSFRKDTRKKEYQLLGHFMKERLCLVLDLQFLKMLLTQSMKSLVFEETWTQLFTNFPRNIPKIIISTCASLVAVAFLIASLVLYHFAPAFYFYKQLFFAIITASSEKFLPAVLGFDSFGFGHCGYCAIIIAILACCFLLVAYFMVAMMFVCYLVAEVTMFTYIGAVLDPSMAFRYVSLVGAVSLVLYNLTKNLRENYDGLRDQIVEILEKKDHLSQLNKEFKIRSEDTFERKEEPDGTVIILLKMTGKQSKVVLHRDHYGTYLSIPLLDFCIEKCDPLRRKVLFMAVKVLLMTFYLSIALWIKNVFHKEKEVSSIFSIIQGIAITFVPSLLQFLVDKGRFGKKNSVDLHRDVHEAIVAFVER